MALQINVDFNQFTIGDLEDFEDIVGKPYAQVFAEGAEGQLSAKAMTALVYITQRREDPNYTLDDARKEKVAALEFASADEAAEDPTDAAS